MTNRMCVSCKKRATKDQLIRISVKDEIPIVDQNKQQNGRAIYVCKNAKCIDKLKKTNAITRMLKVQGNAELYQSLKDYIGDGNEC